MSHRIVVLNLSPQCALTFQDHAPTFSCLSMLLAILVDDDFTGPAEKTEYRAVLMLSYRSSADLALFFCGGSGIGAMDADRRAVVLSEIVRALAWISVYLRASYNSYHNHLTGFGGFESRFVEHQVGRRVARLRGIFMDAYLRYRRRRFLARVAARKWLARRWDPRTPAGKSRLLREFQELSTTEWRNNIPPASPRIL